MTKSTPEERLMQILQKALDIPQTEREAFVDKACDGDHELQREVVDLLSGQRKVSKFRGAANQMLPLVYGELRKLAAARLANEKPGQTLQATALVHEAYLRLVDRPTSQHWDGRGHFFAAAAESMRRILVERWWTESC